MKQSASLEKKSPVLIVDKQGFLGKIIAEKLLETKTVFLVGGEEDLNNGYLNKDFIQILYPKKKEKLPSIPDLSYVYILIIWNGEKEIIDSLAQFIKKSQNDKAELVFITNLYFTNEGLIRRIKYLYQKITIFVFGDLFGGKPLIPTAINKVLYDIKLNKKTKIINSGLKRVYPIFLEDAIHFILEIISGEKKFLKKTFFLFPKHPPTQLSFLRILQKIDPLISVDFINQKDEEKEIIIPEEGDYLLKENYPLKERLKEVFEEILKGKKITKTIETKNQRNDFRQNQNKKNKKNIFLLFLFFIFFAFLLPLITTILFSFLGTKFLVDAKTEAEKSKFLSAYKNSNLSQKFFNFSLVSAKVLFSEAKLINKENNLQNLISTLETGKEMATGVNFSLSAFLKFEKTFKGASAMPREDFIEGLNSLKNAISIFEKTKTKQTNFGFEKNIFLKINNGNQSIQMFSSMIDILPFLFGFEGKKNYLVLFQNNMELRPGGGFIGSYGILTLDKGKIENFNIFDVYDADGQLKGHVEPPFAIRRYLPSVHWYLRDSNFYLDFPQNASSSAFFLKQEMNTIADGVIAIDTKLIKDLLKVMGPIFVSEYNETVTADNFYLLTQTNAEKKTFPGSTQKKDFLRSLFNSLQVSFSTKEQTPYLSLMEVIGNSILEKHVLFAFSDLSIQNLFTVNKMSSSLRDNRENLDNVINDFIGINEANLGVNKVNYFIKRKMTHQVFLEKDKNINGKVEISYKNTSQKNTWQGGNYKNYLRIILPFGAELSSISIDGVLQKTINAITNPIIYEAKNFVPSEELEVEKTVENGKTIYGFLVNVPEEALKTITVSYNFPQKILSTVDSFSYSLIVFKQTGTEDDNFSSIITYPDSFRIINLPKQVRLIGGKAVFSTKLLTDLNFEINFAKK